MKPAPGQVPWLYLRALLFSMGIIGCLLSEHTSTYYMTIGGGVAAAYVIVSSALASLVGTPPILRSLAMLDIILLGTARIVIGDSFFCGTTALFGLIALASFAHGVGLGIACALSASLLYILALVLTPRGLSIGPGLINIGLLAVVGGCGAIARKSDPTPVERRPARAQVVETLDMEIEKAQREARKQTEEKQEKERALYDKQRKLWALVSISHTMSSTRNRAELLSLVVKMAKEEINSAIAFVLLERDPSSTKRGDLVVFHQTCGISEITRRVLAGQQLFQEVIRNGSPIRLIEKEMDPLLLAFQNAREPFRNILAVPLQAQDPVPLGVLCVANALVGDHFSAEDEEFLKILATSAAIALKNAHLNEELEKTNAEIIHALAQAIEAKDPYTHGHVDRVRNYAKDLARALKLAEQEVEMIGKGAILHDVGKISTPNEILNKPGALTPAERRKMDEHVTSSIHVLKDIKSLPHDVFEMVLFHHERFDGKGYPYGLKGEEIPLGARIISIVDAFDAMTTDRPYRKGFSKEKALELLVSGSATQFDPLVLDAFLDVIDTTGEIKRRTRKIEPVSRTS